MYQKISKQYRKVIFCLLAAVILCFLNISTAFATESAVVIVGQATAEQGERVTVSVTLETNPGLAYFRPSIEFDETRLRIDNIGSVTHGDALPRLSFSGLTAATYTQNPFRVLWFGTANDRTTGNLLNIAFTVLEDAPPGNAFVNMTVGERDAFDRDGETVSAEVTGGSVFVTAAETVQTETPETPDDAELGNIEEPQENEATPQNDTASENDLPPDDDAQSAQDTGSHPEIETPPPATPTPTPNVPNISIAPFTPPATGYRVTAAGGIIRIAPTSGDANENVPARLSAPIELDVPLEETASEINHHRLVAVSESGTVLGGTYNPDTGLFSIAIDYTGAFTITYKENLNRFHLRIGTNAIVDIAGNAPDILMDVVPVIIDNRTLIPVRFMAYALGAQVDWNEDTHEVTLALDGASLTFAVDGELTPQLVNLGMDVPAQIIDNRTMVPLRFIGEFFGAIVSWEAETQTVEVIWYS